ncbi:MAG: hypothetical protein ACJ74Z_04560 [Bryobacteraceae bacterium]
MQTVNDWSSRGWRISSICVLLAGFLCMSFPALAQDSSQTTMTGTLVSYSKNTMVVKGEGDRYRLFVFDRNTVKPETLAIGSGVRVISTQTEDPEVRLAVYVAAAEAHPPGAPAPTQPDVVPPSIRNTERAIERETRKFHIGVQGGLALNPELIDIGLNARFGPFFSKNLQFRPNVDFAFGEITKLFALNGDVIYNVAARGAPGSLYFGAGPQFNFVEQSTTSESGVSFSDFHYSTALNVLLGIRMRNGIFTELKTSVWASPAPVLRLMVGYTF